jgi:hypothetical protein
MNNNKYVDLSPSAGTPVERFREFMYSEPHFFTMNEHRVNFGDQHFVEMPRKTQYTLTQ